MIKETVAFQSLNKSIWVCEIGLRKIMSFDRKLRLMRLTSWMLMTLYQFQSPTSLIVTMWIRTKVRIVLKDWFFKFQKIMTWSYNKIIKGTIIPRIRKENQDYSQICQYDVKNPRKTRRLKRKKEGKVQVMFNLKIHLWSVFYHSN